MNIKDKNGDCSGCGGGEFDENGCTFCGKGNQAPKAKSTAQPQSFAQTYWLGMVLAGIGLVALVLFFASSSTVNDITTTMTIEEIAPPKPAPKVISMGGQGLSQLDSIGGGIAFTLESLSLPIFILALVSAMIALFSGRGLGTIAAILFGGLMLGNPVELFSFIMGIH